MKLFIRQDATTSIPSKRWLQFLTSVPVLDIEEFPPHCSEKKKIQLTIFQIVSNIFSNKIHICYDDPSTFIKWISPATAGVLQELDLDVTYSSMNVVNNIPLELATRFFNVIRMLNVLKLSSRVHVDIPDEIVTFPNLKILHLILVEYYSNDRSVRNLFFGCIVLTTC